MATFLLFCHQWTFCQCRNHQIFSRFYSLCDCDFTYKTGQQSYSGAVTLRAAASFTTNLVFMGMGEPLANYASTIAAIRWLTRPEGLDLRQRGVTVSTVGLVRSIERLSMEGLQIGLTISLHAPDDALRRRLIPTAGGTTIDELVAAAREYIERRGRRVTFAYALLDGVNDSEEQARALAQRIRGIQAHVNLIPYNPNASENTPRKASPAPTVSATTARNSSRVSDVVIRECRPES